MNSTIADSDRTRTIRHGVSRGALVNDDDVDPTTIPQVPESGYEPPAVFDFGPVFKTTRGNSNGSGDVSLQRD
jgi:hypothetical protein